MPVAAEKIKNLESNSLAAVAKALEATLGSSPIFKIDWSTFPTDEAADDLIRFLNENLLAAFKSVAKSDLSKQAIQNNIKQIIVENSENVSGQVVIENESLRTVCNWSVHPNPKRIYEGSLVKVLKLDVLDEKSKALKEAIPNVQAEINRVLGRTINLEFDWNTFNRGENVSSATALLSSEIVPAIEAMIIDNKAKTRVSTIETLKIEHWPNLEPEIQLTSGVLSLKAHWSDGGIYRNQLESFFTE